MGRLNRQPERPGPPGREPHRPANQPGPEGIRTDPPRRIGDEMGSLREVSDGALAVAIGRWREDALAEAFRRHAGAVHGLAHRVLRDGAAAEEVVQEVFVRLWNAPDRYDPERGSMRSFLLAQAHGRAVDLLRSDSSRRRREERDASSSPDARYDVEVEVMDLTVAEHLKGAVLALPIEERRAIELAYFGGHTYREVAVLLSEPEGTVKSRIRSGLKRLRVGLTDAGLSSVVSE